ncbi:leucyl/phenylalanyl-tRNA--protein transferase [Novosphingobium sp. PC22D]|nr:leucyl/phenylalanyl-tRNA--protein transferase [Novosphingobium sp. PC22D]
MHAPASPPQIEPQLLMLAYRSGIFPMADHRDDTEVFWIEPRMRAILPLEGFHMSRSLAKTIRRGRFRVTCNQAFSAVIEACAAPRDSESDSWISHRIQASYEELHALGYAHSIECWDDSGESGAPGLLVGGLYGVGFDRVFCGESMFSHQTDASKVALAWLVAALRHAGATLLDCQFMTEHLASLGAAEITQKRYLAMLRAAQDDRDDTATGETRASALPLPEAYASLLSLAESEGLSSSPGKLIAQLLTQTS